MTGRVFTVRHGYGVVVWANRSGVRVRLDSTGTIVRIPFADLRSDPPYLPDRRVQGHRTDQGHGGRRRGYGR